MALSADTPRAYAGGFAPKFNSLPVVSAGTIYEGSAVGESGTTGTYRALNGADTFAGFAHEKVVNATGGSSRVKVRQEGVIRLTVTGASGATDNGVAVYASDDGTFTLTSTTTNSRIGKVHQWITSTTCDVAFQGAVINKVLG